MSAAAAPDPTSWAPVPELLTATVQMLEHSRSTDNVLQRQAYEALEQSKANPEFLRYLVYCVVYGSGLPAGVRAVAGATAKAVVEWGFSSLPADVRAHVKAEVVKMLPDSVDLIRRMAANIVSSIVREEGLESWLELPPVLTALLGVAGSSSPDALDGGLTVALQLFEDAPQDWDSSELGHPLSAIFPLLVAAMGSAAEPVRLKATKAAGMLQHTGAPALATNRHAYLAALARLTADPSPAVREAVSFSLGYLLETDAAGVWPSLPSIFEFQLQCLADAHDGVALAGADFFSGYAEAVSAHAREGQPAFHVIDPFMERIVRGLLGRMLLSDEEAAEATASDARAAAAAPDTDADVEPTIARGSRAAASGAGAAVGKEGALGGAGESPWAGAAASAAAQAPSDADEEEDEEEDGERDIGRNPNAGGAFTPRKAAGGALETLALIHPTTVLPLTMAAVGELLSKQGDDEAAWRSREAGLLALGCLAYGCSDRMAEFLPQMYPFLLATSRDTRPLLRVSAVWALSQYAGWVTEMHILGAEDRADAEARGDVAAAASADYLTPLMALLLERLADPVKTVQHAALKAMAEVVTAAQEAAAPYAAATLAALLAAVPRYQLRSRLLAYDCIATLAEHAPEEAATAEQVAVLLPGLCDRLEGLPDDAFEATSVMCCLTGVCTANHADTLPFMPRLLARTSALLERELVMEAVLADEEASAVGTTVAAAAAPGARGGAGNTSRMSVCLDLLDVIVDAAGGALTDALCAESAGLPEWLDLTLPHPSPAVRTSALCLLGTLALRVPAALTAPRPTRGGPLLEAAARHLTPSIRLTAANVQACNNAVWALGQLVKAFGREPMGRVLPQALPRLLDVLFASGAAARRLHENVAITLGILGAAFPEVMAPALPAMVDRWCEALKRVTAPEERADAYVGLCALLATGPGPVAEGGHLPNVVRALLCYRAPPPPALAAIHAAWAAVQAAASAGALTALTEALTTKERAEAAALLTSAA